MVDKDFTWGYIALSNAQLSVGDADAAVNSMRQAIAQQPNDYETNLFLGLYLQFAGESALAVEHFQLAKRLSPVDTVRNLAFLAYAEFMNRNYVEAVRLFTARYQKFPVGGPQGRVMLAASLVLLDRPDDATKVVGESRYAQPWRSLKWITKSSISI